MITADEVQFRYPNPASDSLSGGYCVGGALCLVVEPQTTITFPSSLTLARVLSQVNPALQYSEAHNFACLIIKKNDTARFDAAWLALREALKWESNRSDDEAASLTKAGSSS